MAFNLHNRNFLSLKDFTAREIRFLLDLAAELKSARYVGTERPRLRGKHIALIFEKDSTRTRIGFEIAAADQGMHATYLGPTGTHLGHKETAKDTARVLDRIYDAIEYRGFSQETVQILADHASVPVYNGLTDEFHPTQILADFLTMQEHSAKRLADISFCFVGDTGSNMGDSLLIGAAKMGMDIRLCGPEPTWPEDAVMRYARELAEHSGAHIMLTSRIDEAIEGVDFIYTDVWLSMGDPESEWEQRIGMMKPYQVDARMMTSTGNPEVKFMHCLPAFHNAETAVGAGIRERFGLDAMEVTEEVFESESSIVFDQAENRMHTIKAVLVATISN